MRKKKQKQFATAVSSFDDVKQVLEWGVRVVTAFQIPGDNFITVIYED